MTTYNGSCHCGETEWSVKLDDDSHILCHCNACKLLGGGGYSLNNVTSKENLKITKGDLKPYTYYGDSGKAVNCYHCPNCTSHAYHHHEVMGPDKIIVRTVFLNGYRDFSVSVELYGKDRFSWQKAVDGVHTFDAGPPS